MTARELTEARAECDRLRDELAHAQEVLREFARERDAHRRDAEAEREKRRAAEAERDALRPRLAEAERELLATTNGSDQQRERAKRAERERDEARFNYDIARVNYEETRAWLLDAHKSDPNAAAEYEAYVVAGFTLPDAVRAMRSERDAARRVAKSLALYREHALRGTLEEWDADQRTAIAYEVEP